MRSVALACLVFLGVHLGLSGEESPGDGDLRRRVGVTGLWPFYSREDYEGGATRTTSLLGLYRNEEEGQGGWYQHLLPLYSASGHRAEEKGHLSLYPLLHFRSHAAGSGSTFSLPLWYSWWNGATSHRLLWPFYHSADRPDPVPYEWIPVFYRSGRDLPTGEERRRLGVPLLLQLFEGSHREDRSALAFGVFFNLGEETRSGLALSRFERSEERGREGYVFPIFSLRDDRDDGHVISPLFATWRSSGGRRGWLVPPLLTGGTWHDEGHDVHVLAPLLRFRDDELGHEDRVVPFYLAGDDYRARSWYRFYSIFYGRVEGEADGSRDDYFPLLLGRHHRDAEAWGLDVLWPLGHYSESRRDPALHKVRALPFYDRHRGEQGDWMGVGGFLYRRHESSLEGSLSQWVLWPLIHWRSSPPGHLAWALPFFFHRDDEEYGNVNRVTFVAPSFVKTLRSSGWKIDDATRGEYHASSLHLWPLFGVGGEIQSQFDQENNVKTLRDESSLSTLYPLFNWTKIRIEPGSIEGWRVEAPWPLLQVEREGSRWSGLLAPLLYAGGGDQRNYAYLYPIFGFEKGQEARFSFWTFTSFFGYYDGPDELRCAVFPFLFEWSSRADGLSALTGPFYLFHWRSRPLESWFHLAPLVYASSSPGGSHLGVFPFYYQEDLARGFAAGWSSWRFAFVWNWLTSEEESHWSLLWKLAERTTSASGDHDFRLLHRFVVHRSVQGQKEFIVNPFYESFEDSRTGARSFAILKILFRQDVEAGEETTRILMIPVSRRPVEPK